MDVNMDSVVSVPTFSEDDLDKASAPSLTLVGGCGTTANKNNGPRLVAVSSEDQDKNNDEAEENAAAGKNSPSQSGSLTEKPEESSARPRLTTTLLIFKKPTDVGDSYTIANPPPDEDQDAEQRRKKHKKKKKKQKSKERLMSISRSQAMKLLELQKAITNFSTKPKREMVEDFERHRKMQAITSIRSSPVKSSIPSPLSGKPSLSQGYKTMKTPLSRKRQMSTSNSMEITSSKRRFTRKKRFDIEEDKTNGLASSGEDIKKNHLSENNVWSPLDDYRLLINISQTKGNLEEVFAGTKFSCFYTIDQVEQRWRMLLYDEKAGILAQQAINNLHPQVKVKIQSEALFSGDEEDLLRTVKMIPGCNPDLSYFITLLDEHPQVFTYRTPRKLLLHWLEMKSFHLLEGQNVQDYKDPFNLFELQDAAYLSSIPDMAVLNELQMESKQVKRQIRILEEELESWHCMQELVVSDGSTDLQSIFSTSEFDDQTYAVLRGKQVRYCMRSREILLGRHSTNNKVDADLTLEGASGKVSRRQAIIQMHGFGEFFIINQGRHSIFVDSTHVPYGGMTKLTDGCVIQITQIKLIFKINEKLMRKEISHEVKKEVINARLKSYDNFSAGTFPSPSAVRSGFAADAFPSTSRFPSPKKKTLSAANSPVLSLSGSPVTSASLKSSVNRSASIGPSILPFTSDLTIRSTSQPPLLSPFLYDNSTKTLCASSVINSPSSISDNDVFKKPAPVTLSRLSTSKPSAVSVAMKFSGSSTSSAMNVPATQSAFVSVGSTSSLPSGAAVYSTSVDSTATSPKTSYSVLTPVSASLPTPNQLMDYSKLGLSSDITVTQRKGDTSSTAISSQEKMDTTDFTANSIRTPTLGLVKMESQSSSSVADRPI